jgi:uncharacterized protein YjbJ (UPF0337 family)
MDSDRVEGKTKQLEGEAQEGWGKLKDKGVKGRSKMTKAELARAVGGRS